MSKSTKEKERLKSIKMYEQHGIPVPLELIKIKLIFKEPKRNNLNITKQMLKTFYNEHWVREKIHAKLLTYIRNSIIDMARSIKMYDFKVQFQLLKMHVRDNKLFMVSLMFDLIDRKNNVIGQIIPNDLYLNLKSEYFDGSKKIPHDILNTVLKRLDEAPPYQSKLIINTRIYNNNYSHKIKKFKSDCYYRQLINDFIQKSNKYLTKLSLSRRFLFEHGSLLGINRSVCALYVTNDGIHVQITGEKEGSKNKILFDISKNVCPLKFIKMLIVFEVIDVNIPEDKFTLENLPEIENMIRIANY